MAVYCSECGDAVSRHDAREIGISDANGIPEPMYLCDACADNAAFSNMVLDEWIWIAEDENLMEE